MRRALTDRSQYPTLASSTYLNQASLGLIGEPAVSVMHAHLDDIARHGNLHLSDEEEVAILDGLRERTAALTGSAPDRIAIVPGASDLLGQAPFLMPPPPGSTVLAVGTDFPAVTRPWLGQATSGYEIRFVEDRPDADLTDALVGALDERTAVLATSWVQYATGTVVDVPRLRAATRAVGSRLLVDATQGLGAMPADVAGWQADLVVSSGYKWLGGHGGAAVGVLGRGLTGRDPVLAGWMGAPSPFDLDATRLDWAGDARRFTASTMSYVSVEGLRAAIDQLLDVGPSHIEAHAAGLATALVDAVRPHGWAPFRDPSDPAAAPHIVSLAPAGGADGGTPGRLRKRGVVCSGRGGRLRVSLAHYNDEEDVHTLASVLGG